MKKIIKSYFIGLLFNIIIILISSFIVTTLIDSKEIIIGQSYELYFFVPKVISYILSSLFVSYKIGERGLFHGFLFCLFAVTFYSIFNFLAFNVYGMNLFNTSISLIISSLCGSIGVNLRRK